MWTLHTPEQTHAAFNASIDITAVKHHQHAGMLKAAARNATIERHCTIAADSAGVVGTGQLNSAYQSCIIEAVPSGTNKPTYLASVPR